MRPDILHVDKKPVVGVHIFPGLRPDMLESCAEAHHALILFGNALGGIARDLIPTFKKIIENGTAVFMLTDNAGARHGVVRIVDQPQVEAIKAGVTYLETVNITHQQEVFRVIDAAIAKGLRGSDLARHVQEQFKYPEGAKPVSDLGTEQGLAAYHDRVQEELGLDERSSSQEN